MESNLIERQAVLDTIHRFFTEEVDKIPTKKTEDGEVYVIHKCQPLFEMNKTICKRIKALPSVSPTQNCVENALDMRCDDAISRQAVIDAIEDDNRNGHYSCFASNNDAQCFKDVIRSLPSVNLQEKTGHWIEKDGFDGDVYYDCSECGESWTTIEGTPWDNEWDYCPSCGARMESEE